MLKAAGWRVGQLVRDRLRAAGDQHPVTVAYRHARRLPLVRGIWRRLVGANENSLFEVAQYERMGGRFRPSRADAVPLPLPSDADGAFLALADRAEAHERPYLPVAGRILIVNCGLSAGGAERQIANTLRGLAERGADVAFVGEYLERAPDLDFHAEGLRKDGAQVNQALRRATAGPKLYEGVTRPVAEALAAFPADIRLEVLDMAAEIRARRPEVVHLWQDQTSVKHGFAALIAQTPRIVLSGRNVNPTHFGYHTPWLRPGYRALASRSNVTFSNNSEAGAKSYAEWLGVPEDRIRVIRNGVGFPAFRSATPFDVQRFRAKLGVPDDGRLVAGVMRLSAEKRPLLWIDAAASAARSDPRLHFVIAGTGPMAGACEAAIAKRNLQGRLSLIGEHPRPELVLAAADLVFLTSEFEGTPNVLLEAQWLGRPVLSTKAGGALETFLPGITGAAAEAETPAGLAEQMLRMLADSGLAERAARDAPAFVEARFGLQRMIDETLALYGLG